MSRHQDSASDNSSDEDRDPSHAQEQRENLIFIKEMEFQLKKHNRRLRQIARELVSARTRLDPEESDENQEGDEADQAQLQNVAELETRYQAMLKRTQFYLQQLEVAKQTYRELSDQNYPGSSIPNRHYGSQPKPIRRKEPLHQEPSHRALKVEHPVSHGSSSPPLSP